MAATAHRLNDALTYELAEVTSVTAEGMRVRAAGGEYRARRAASCLLAPALGDRVAVLSAARGDCWVVAVLDRASPDTAAEVGVEGDMALRAGGTVSLEGARGVSIAGPAVRVATRALEVAAAEGRAVLETLSVLAGAAEAELGRARLTTGALDVVAERVHTRAKRVMRFVEEVEQLRVGGLDVVARRLMNLRGGTAVVSAEEVVKVDGAQVLIG